jgi:hypothetical protein
MSRQYDMTDNRIFFAEFLPRLLQKKSVLLFLRLRPLNYWLFMLKQMLESALSMSDLAPTLSPQKPACDQYTTCAVSISGKTRMRADDRDPLFTIATSPESPGETDRSASRDDPYIQLL